MVICCSAYYDASDTSYLCRPDSDANMDADASDTSLSDAAVVLSFS